MPSDLRTAWKRRSFRQRSQAIMSAANDGRGDDVLDALTADKEMADIIGAEDPVEVGAFKAVGAEIDHDRFMRGRSQRSDDLDLPRANDAFVLVFRTLQQRVVLVSGNSGKPGRQPILTNMVSMPRLRAMARTFCAFLTALFFSI